MRNAFRLWLMLGSLALGTLILACGGSASPADSPSSQPQSSTTGDASGGSPPAAVVEPTATATVDNPWFLPPPPEGLSASYESPDESTSLLGRADRDAGRAITQALLDAGDDLAGVELYVFPVKGSDHTLLVVEMPLSLSIASEDGAQQSQSLFTPEFLHSELVREANVSRVVLHLRAKDESTGSTSIMSLTLPIETLISYLEGTVSDEQMSNDLYFQVIEVEP